MKILKDITIFLSFLVITILIFNYFGFNISEKITSFAISEQNNKDSLERIPEKFIIKEEEKVRRERIKKDILDSSRDF